MRRGVTMIEFVIGWSIIGILACIFVSVMTASGGAFVTTESREATAERNARAFAEKMDWKIQHVVCSGVDSPGRDGRGDGYVSCTVDLLGDEDAEGDDAGTDDTPKKHQTRTIYCGYDILVAPFGQNTSCKEPTPLSVQ